MPIGLTGNAEEDINELYGGLRAFAFPSRRDQSALLPVFILIGKSARKLVLRLSENQCHVFADFQRPRFLAARGSSDRQKYSTDLSKPPPATRLGGRGLPRKANGVSC